MPRSLVLEVSARLDRYGAVVAEATDAELDAIAEHVRRGEGRCSHSHAAARLCATGVRGRYRRRVASPAAGVAMTPSAAIWPERREYERCLVALMNAYIEPMMTDYLTRLSQRIRRLGIDAPVYITSNNGGTLSIDTARQRPIDTILSGPASGVVAAAAVASHTPYRNLITVDMGGTSADMSVVQELEPAQTTRTSVGNLPIIVPVVSVTAIGAGGGSIIWVDAQGVAEGGSAQCGRAAGPGLLRRRRHRGDGDRLLCRRRIHRPHTFPRRTPAAGCRGGAARSGNVADALGMAGEDRAERVAQSALRIATASMASEIARDLAQKGEDARDYALIAFGGAGPTQALHLAEEVGISRVIIPAGAEHILRAGCDPG